MDCGCLYCRTCLECMVRARLNDTGFRLPQCCSEVLDWEVLQLMIDSDLAAAFDKKKTDFESVRPAPCANKTCAGSSALIAPEHHSADGATATCPVCGKSVCTACKQASHPGRECVPDAAMEQTLEVIREEEWQICPRCGGGFERDEGCSHMKWVYFTLIISMLLGRRTADFF